MATHGRSRDEIRRVAVVGGAMAGLAAAEGLTDAGFDVDLFERQSYADKRVNCGEAMTSVSSIPLDPTPENGFLNSLPELKVSVYDGTDPDRRRTGYGTFPAPNAYITDRNLVEQSWANRLRERGVTVHEDHPITTEQFRDLSDEYDLVIDATGQPSITSHVRETISEYAGQLVALNADLEGDFADLYPNSRIVIEDYTGYSWAFPKTPTRANVGIGWTESERPDDYMAAFHAACERNDWPTPDQDQTNVATIPEGPSLDPEATYLPEYPVVRVGDAAGIANRLTGKGISQAVQSSYLAADLAANGRLHEYPDRLYRTMKAEYLLARLIRQLIETRQLDLLGDAVEAVSGLDIEEVDRSPKSVLGRLVRRPILAARIFGKPKVLKHLYATVTDSWEYNAP